MTLEILVALCAFGFVISVLPLSPGVYVFLAVASAILSSTSLLPSNAFLSGAVRILVCYWLLLALMKHGPGPKTQLSLGNDRESYIERANRFLMIFFAYLVFFVINFLVNPTEPLRLAEQLIGIVIGALTIVLLLGCTFPVVGSLSWALTTALVLSLMSGVFFPADSIVQGRLAGIFVNANSTGFVGAALIATVALRGKVTPLGWVQIAVGCSAIAWTASRTSAVVGAFILLALLFNRARWELRVLWIITGVGVAYFVFPGLEASVSDHLLFRGAQSRLEWDWALETLRANPIHGVGNVLTPSGKEVATGVGSSILTLAVIGGSIGLLLFAAIAAILVVNAWRSGYRTTVISLGFIAHSIFESWLAAPGSPVMLIVFFVLVAAMQRDEMETSRSALKSGADPVKSHGLHKTSVSTPVEYA